MYVDAHLLLEPGGIYATGFQRPSRPSFLGRLPTSLSLRENPPPTHRIQLTKQQPHKASAGGDVGRGAGDIGKGTAKGAGAAAKGVGKGAGDLVTLHPLAAAGNVGKGGVVGGKDVGVGAAKGTGKSAKGTGRGIGKLFHHHHEKQTAPAHSEAQN